MNKLLTISIAAYNCEQYIKKTLSSVVVPEILDLLEVFVIDDGSTDNTLIISKEFEQKYPETFKVIHKENGGYGSTVNLSLSQASGKFFKLLDGDDWFEKKELIKLVSVLSDTNADVIISNFYKCPENSEKIQVPHGYQCRETELFNFVPNKSFGVWTTTYKTEILRSSKLVLPQHRLYTDQIYCTIPFKFARTILFSDDCTYCYRTGRAGQSVSRLSRIKHLDDMICVCSIINSFCSENRHCENYQYLLFKAARYHNCTIKTLLLKKATISTVKQIKDYENKVRLAAPDIFDAAVKCGKFGKLLKILRKTDYYLCLGLRLIPGGFPNWE